MVFGIPAAVVTGANKGIGLQIIKELCAKNFKGTIYLTARDRTRGQDAVRQLQNDGFLDVEYLNLDVNDVGTVKTASEYLKSEHGGLDILVNNAGVLMHSNSPEEFLKETETTMRTNFYGVVDVCNHMFPLLRPHARIVNMSSSIGSLRFLKDSKIKARLVADDLSVEELKGIVSDYESAVKKGNYAELGYPGYPKQYGSYPMSKIALTALTRIHQRFFDKERPNDDIIVNACDPGYVSTDMTQGKGTRTVEEGAETPVYLALLPPTAAENPRGQLVSNKKLVPWTKY